MRIVQAGTAAILVLFCLCIHAETPSRKIAVTGTLSRALAIGAESTGWIVQLDSETTIDGKPVSSIQVSESRKPERLESLNTSTSGSLANSITGMEWRLGSNLLSRFLQ